MLKTKKGNWALEVCFISRNKVNNWEVVDYFSDYYEAYAEMDKAFRNTQGLVLVVYRVVKVY